MTKINRYCDGCKHDNTGRGYNPKALPATFCTDCFQGNKYDPADPKYDRLAEVEHFIDQLRKHVVQYTIPKYSNAEGDDQASKFTVEDCVQQMLTYVNRRHARVRGNKEALRDWLKVAHYANFIYHKLQDEMKEPDVY